MSTRREGVEVLIALGANLGDRRATLDGAVAALAAEPGLAVLGVSPWIETRSVGGPDGQPDYLNGAARLACELTARALLERLFAIERRFGRDRARELRRGPRPLDLDLLVYGDEEIDEPGLVVPHPRLEERVFVLAPLAHLVPDRRLPRSGLTVVERLAALRAPA